jgi:ribosomal protein L20
MCRAAKEKAIAERKERQEKAAKKNKGFFSTAFGMSKKNEKDEEVEEEDDYEDREEVKGFIKRLMIGRGILVR